MLKFVKQIENNLMICPKETEGAGNRSKMDGVERLFPVRQKLINPVFHFVAKFFYVVSQK